LFLAHLPFDDDVRHIGKSAMTDQKQCQRSSRSCVVITRSLWAT
jgi:hypothetical protein